MAIIQRDPVDEMIHREPFRSLESLQREMNRIFDRLMPGGNGEGRSLTFLPSVEVEEADDTIHLKVEVPGMDAKDLDVEVTDDLVSIKGERKSESKTEEKGMVRSEFHYGKFERQIALPAHVQPGQARAEYKHGILTLTLPKLPSEPRRSVKVSIT
jgi:HSP20 family protein